LQKLPIKIITTIKPNEANTPRSTEDLILFEKLLLVVHATNKDQNQARPTNDTGIKIPGTVPHGPFVTLSQPLPTPQPGIESNSPSFVPDRTKEEPVATSSNNAPI